MPGGQDFDVHAGWRAIAACVRDALRAAGATGDDVAAVAATSMREGMVLYDQGGQEIWACPNVDSRSAAELGAHFVKTYYCEKDFDTVAAACPVPLVMAGGQEAART